MPLIKLILAALILNMLSTKQKDQRLIFRRMMGNYFPLFFPICSNLDSFPFVESHKIFYSQPGSLLTIVLVLAGDRILKFHGRHGPHPGLWTLM